MKTKVLIAAAFFLAGNAMSQSVSSKNYASSKTSATALPKEQQVSNSSTLSSSTKPNADANAGANVRAAAQAASEIKASQEARGDETKAHVRDASEDINQNVKAGKKGSSFIETGATAKIQTKHNKTGVNSSLNTGAGVSARNSVQPSVIVKNTQVATKKTVRISENTAGRVKTNGNGSSRTCINGSSSVKASAANAAPKPRVKGSVLSRSAVTIR